MASTMATVRGMGFQFQNARMIRHYTTLSTWRTSASNGTALFRSPAIRSFTQTASRSRAVNPTPPSTARPKPLLRLSGSFFSTRSIAAPKTLLQQIRARLFHTSRVRRNVPSPNPTPHLNSPGGVTGKSENLSLGQRMRKLSREYGWSAVGVYFLLSTLDFPFCYLLVRWLGTDRIGRWEHIVVDNVKVLIPEPMKETWHGWRESMKKESAEIDQGVEMAGWGVEEAEEANKKEASLATQLALAYAIHKSFIFIRVPLTVAVTPKVVKVLRGWGFDIGKRTTKATRVANAAEVAAQKAEKAARKAQK